MLRLLLFSACAAPIALLAATAEEEYQQVRTIALRDAKVREAYEDADRKLLEKIIRIDPALENYARHRGHASAPPAGFHQPAPAREHPSATPPAKSARSHLVLKGETLSSIALIFGVQVDALKKANHIEDEHKLRVGQTLSIPDRTR